MGLETGTYISDLVATNPLSSDAKSAGDDHIRLVKLCLQNSFPAVTGAVTATHTQLNTVPDLAPKASPTFTGVPAAPTATLGTSTTQIATTAFVAAASLAAAGVPDQSGNGGKFLTTDGSAASWGTPANGLVLLATLTPTAAANVDFLSTFSSTYDNYLIIGQGIKPSSDESLLLRFAVAGSVDTGTNYFTSTGTSASATSFSSVMTTTTSAGVGGGFSIQIQNANDATNIKTGSVSAMSQDAATPTVVSLSRGIAYIAANAISGFRLYWNGGANFAATGKVYVYGYSKA